LNEYTGFHRNGIRADRDKPIKVTAGLIIYKGEGDQYYLDFPYGKDMGRISATAKEVSDFFYYLEKTDGDLDKAHDKVWG
jgi:hypothetical protein